VIESHGFLGWSRVRLHILSGAGGRGRRK
jgi:hypothetical protein